MFAIAGSRDWTNRTLVATVVRTLLERGMIVTTGCAVGADQLTIQTALALGRPNQLVIFAVGGQDGGGFWRQSAREDVRNAVWQMARIHWWAGGYGDLVDRLRRRSDAMIATVASEPGAKGLVAFVLEQGTPGTMRTMRAAAQQHIPVVCFASQKGRMLPPKSLGEGRWVRTKEGTESIWAQSWRWQPWEAMG